LFTLAWKFSQVNSESEDSGRVGQEPPAPVVGGQDAQRLVHEDAAALRGGELAAVVVEVVEALDVVDELPVLARAHDGHGEGEGVEGHVVLAHELGVADVARAAFGAPPASQSASGRPCASVHSLAQAMYSMGASNQT
jgi:hypothetical protein